MIIRDVNLENRLRCYQQTSGQYIAGVRFCGKIKCGQILFDQMP